MSVESFPLLLINSLCKVHCISDLIWNSPIVCKTVVEPATWKYLRVREKEKHSHLNSHSIIELVSIALLFFSQDEGRTVCGFYCPHGGFLIKWNEMRPWGHLTLLYFIGMDQYASHGPIYTSYTNIHPPTNIHHTPSHQPIHGPIYIKHIWKMGKVSCGTQCAGAAIFISL